MMKEDNIVYLVFGLLIGVILLLAFFAIRSYTNQWLSFTSSASEYLAIVSQ